MAYKRPITCRACGTRGHNRASCPALAARIEELRSIHGSDHWQVSSYDRRRASAKSRACSYCQESSHNRASCPTIASHAEKMRPAISAFRKAYIDALCKIGFVPGTIALHDHGGGIRNMYLVERIDLDKIDICTHIPNPTVVRGLSVSGMEENDYRRKWYVNDTGTLGFYLDSTSAIGYDNTPRFDSVIAAGCPDSFRASVSNDWLEAKDLSAIFANTNHSHCRRSSHGEYLVEKLETGELSRKSELLALKVDDFLDFSGQNPYA